MMNKEISKIKAQWDIAYNLVTDLFKDKVDKIKPIKGAHKFKNILSYSLIKKE